MAEEFDIARVTVVDHPMVQHKLSILRDAKPAQSSSAKS